MLPIMILWRVLHLSTYTTWSYRSRCRDIKRLKSENDADLIVGSLRTTQLANVPRTFPDKILKGFDYLADDCGFEQDTYY